MMNLSRRNNVKLMKNKSDLDEPNQDDQQDLVEKLDCLTINALMDRFHRVRVNLLSFPMSTCSTDTFCHLQVLILKTC